MDNRLLNAANGFMGRSSYEQREMNEMALGELEIDIPVGDEEEIDGEVGADLDIDALDGEVEVDADDELGDEEVEEVMMPVALAIRALQLMATGDAETPEEALEQVQAMDDGEAELAPDADAETEGEPEDELAPDEEDESLDIGEDAESDEDELVETDDEEVGAGEEELGEADEEVVDECDGKGPKKEIDEEEDQEQYGESHSMFLKYSALYL